MECAPLYAVGRVPLPEPVSERAAKVGSGSGAEIFYAFETSGSMRIAALGLMSRECHNPTFDRGNYSPDLNLIRIAKTNSPRRRAAMTSLILKCFDATLNAPLATRGAGCQATRTGGDWHS
jgi:hypothetical protein